ncbi:PEP-CTERM-box response regulator transcription factor [Desertibaculum subflavum]|uniref:PEP-CTERM-box response regulator transcription factor n=1 Tax=Desertibaculum subflavum TaxID=2268458 RepID=UPI000E66DB79
MTERRPLLLVEDDVGLQRQMTWALGDEFDVSVAGSRAAAMEMVKGRDEGFPVAVLDLGLPPDENGATEGLALLQEILAHAPATKVIVASGNEERANAVKAISIGAYDFYGKPVDIDVLGLIIRRAIHLYDLEAENRSLHQKADSPLAGLVTADPDVLRVCRSVERFANTDVNVLIIGESGTGKELIARGIHDLGNRRGKPFVAINCASIPETLLESELFGYEKGSFTGAVKTTPGKVEVANTGTLFLDEIGDLPLSLQAKLLRFLQERRVERIGGRQPIPVDVRIVSATNQDLATMIGTGRFREDLYYRLNEVRVDMPPLRARPGDPLLLANFFLGGFNRAYKRAVRGFAPDAITAIGSHPWPGNVRELENRMKRAVIMCEGKLITAADLDLAAPASDQEEVLDLKEARDRTDRLTIQRALMHAQGNISKAAKVLGVTRPTLYYLIKTLDVKI